jgi:hypothetical protein
MSKEQRGNREAKKPKKTQTKTIAAAPARTLDAPKGSAPARPTDNRKR